MSATVPYDWVRRSAVVRRVRAAIYWTPDSVGTCRSCTTSEGRRLLGYGGGEGGPICESRHVSRSRIGDLSISLNLCGCAVWMIVCCVSEWMTRLGIHEEGFRYVIITPIYFTLDKLSRHNRISILDRRNAKLPCQDNFSLLSWSLLTCRYS